MTAGDSKRGEVSRSREVRKMQRDGEEEVVMRKEREVSKARKRCAVRLKPRVWQLCPGAEGHSAKNTLL